MDLSKIGAILRENEGMTEESREILEKYVIKMLSEDTEEFTSENRLERIKKILYTLGMSYPEFHTIYAMLDQEYDAVYNGD